MRPDELAGRSLVMAALVGGEVIADKTFAPGARVSVGSNSGNDLVIDGKYELTSYALVGPGPTLLLAPPLNVQATVWHEGQPLELKGTFRELRRKHPGLPDVLPLASERFVVTYATGIAFLGRFV